MITRQGVNKKILFFLSFLVLIYPLLPVAHFFLPLVTLFGKNIYIVFPVIVISISFFFLLITRQLPSRGVFLFFILFFIYLFVTLIAIIVYDYGHQEFLYRRFLLVPLLMLLTTVPLLSTEDNRKHITKLILMTIFLQCILGLIHYIFFPEIWFINDETFSGFIDISQSLGFVASTREGGTLISSSCFAYLLLCGILLLVYLQELPWKYTGMRQRSAALIFFLFGIMLSGSRGPTILALLFILVFFLREWNIVKKPILFLLIVLIIVVSFKDAFIHIVERFEINGSGGRYEKLQIAALLLSQDLYFFIGAPADVVSTTFINGVSLSDNSFALLFITYGCLSIVFFLSLFYFFWRFSKVTRTYLPALSGFICMCTTNSILWEPWLYYYVMTMVLIWFARKEQLRGISRGALF